MTSSDCKYCASEAIGQVYLWIEWQPRRFLKVCAVGQVNTIMMRAWNIHAENWNPWNRCKNSEAYYIKPIRCSDRNNTLYLYQERKKTLLSKVEGIKQLWFTHSHSLTPSLRSMVKRRTRSCATWKPHWVLVNRFFGHNAYRSYFFITRNCSVHTRAHRWNRSFMLSENCENFPIWYGLRVFFSSNKWIFFGTVSSERHHENQSKCVKSKIEQKRNEIRT